MVFRRGATVNETGKAVRTLARVRLESDELSPMRDQNVSKVIMAILHFRSHDSQKVASVGDGT